VPGFPALRNGIAEQQTIATLTTPFGAVTLRRGALAESSHPPIAAYLIDAPGLYDRPGNPYADANQQAYPDNDRRFALLGWLAARLAEGLDPDWQAQVIHGHDWHAGLAAAYLKASEWSTGRKLAGSVFTVHNLAYQGTFAAQIFGALALPAPFFGINGVEFHGQVSFLKSGLFYSDKLTTVSPTYAREIQGAEQGCGLDGLLRSRAADLHGILNGVDPDVWSPAIDTAIAAPYSPRSLSGKLKCKTALQTEAGLQVQNDAPLFGVVSRFTEQKGLNLVLAGLPEILRQGGQLILLGSGDAGLQAAFQAAAQAHPHAVALQTGYDEQKSHRIMAGCDVILVPSRFEPCGLTQLYGLMYGSLPLVRNVGGLADTVVDCTLENLADASATGFVFDTFEVAAFNTAVRRAFALYGRKSEWKQVQKRGMQQSFDWDAAARKFLALYEEVAV
jgi:starch synthase